MSGFLDFLTHVPALVVLSSVGGLVFGEAAVFLGFVFPGETAVLLAGFLASTGRVSVVALGIVVVVAAIVGDSVGYEVGKHLGPRLEVSWIGRRVGQRRWDTAQLFLDTHGGKSVFLGRSVALLRALVPGLAGMSGMKYRRFLGWNALGGLVWGGGCVLLGYFFARSIRRVEQYLSYGGFVLFTLVVLGFVGWHFYKRRRDAQVSP